MVETQPDVYGDYYPLGEDLQLPVAIYFPQYKFDSDCEEDDFDCFLREIDELTDELEDFVSACETDDADCLEAELD